MKSPGDAPRAARPSMWLGAAQAVGFLLGGLAGRYLGLAFGCDALDPGYRGGVMIGIVLVALGGGLGAQLGRAAFVRGASAPRA